MSRFGDGEMLLTNAHKRIGFQEGNPQLAQRLKEVLTSDNDKHLVCISDVFQHLEPESATLLAHSLLYLRLVVGPAITSRTNLL